VLRALPEMIGRAPAAVRIAAGLVLVLMGALVVSRPLTSLLLLGIYIGVSAILSGLAELASTHSSRSVWTRLFAGAWVVLGVLVLGFLGRSLELLPLAVAFLLLFGGLASIGDAIAGGSPTERLLAGAWGASQVVFGALAFAWPDVTVFVVAVVFGIRTVVFGGSLVYRGIRDSAGDPRVDSTPAAATAGVSAAPWRLRLVSAGRVVLSATLVALAAAGWAMNDWLAEGAPIVDAFYEPPAVVPDDHGRLIRSDSFTGQVPAGAEVRRILYTTRTATGAEAVASAIVISPTESRPGPRPVVSWNHGTTGVARGCAPSLRDEAATAWMIPAVDAVVERGWVVVASDYSGQGAPGVFPYLIGEGEARSSLDAVLAAREIDGLALAPEVTAWGHSQGGHAALWMSQVAQVYAPEVDIVGTAVLAPVTDPLELAEELTAGDANAMLSVLIAWVLVPYADTYADVSLTRYVSPGARTIVREMTQRCLSEPGVMISAATALGVSEDRPLYVGDLTRGPLGDRLAANAVSGPFEDPLLVAWGTEDDVIPPLLQRRFVERLCAEGEEVRWVVFEGHGHLTTLQPGSRFLPVLVNWTDARFRGLPGPVDGCS
jgi:uncharacterized membrane protein HdeD (DUF308 family)